MKDVYSITAATDPGNDLYAFIDDVNIVGAPESVIKAFDVLLSELNKVDLECNMNKTKFIFFHDQCKLNSSVIEYLNNHHIEVKEDTAVVLGAVIGKNGEHIKEGLRRHMKDMKLFLQRLTNPHMSVQAGMMMLRKCGIPKLNYLLRCTPPSAIEEMAMQMDEDILDTVKVMLDLTQQERHNEDVIDLLQAPLCYGGFGLQSALKKSPLAYIASLATVIDVGVFSSFGGDPDALLHNSMPYWELRQCLHQVRSLLSIDDDIENTLLPSSPNEFFSFFAQHHNLISHLQHNLNSQATKLTHQASLRKAQDEDDTVTQARLTSIPSPYASVWKDTTPSIPELRLADPHYRIASRMNLGLPAFVHLPDKCYSCGKNGACARDPYHYLTKRIKSQPETSIQADIK